MSLFSYKNKNYKNKSLKRKKKKRFYNHRRWFNNNKVSYHVFLLRFDDKGQ